MFTLLALLVLCVSTGKNNENIIEINWLIHLNVSMIMPLIFFFWLNKKQKDYLILTSNAFFVHFHNFLLVVLSRHKFD